ncbi:GntR family transcriptional regulator [Saccharopolyspora subtropica]|uniref:GntR family transcriptional regulator n=1 Tax=Saccharopolyspora thermophila TaxID=89367 RepID=A0A917NDC2_9PSEU|nr:FadR/GntR family transcriptional regulator [Saccharopolyspora subtropica]GGI86737.1 GntR family transcriptional regulator [Saccharopolyspora subtropica]
MNDARFQQVRPVRLYQTIVEQIEGAIARGEFRPGQRLPNERELVAQFGASRPTVREALRVLEANGVIRSRPGDPHGPEVLPFSPSGLAKQMTRLAQLEEMSVAELVAFRMILDSAANLLAARLRSAAELAAMERTLAVMAEAIDRGYDEFSKADVAFHDAIASASRNSLIQVCNNVVRGVVLSLIEDRVARSRNSRALMRESLQHHREVLAAIRAGDGQAAARISRRNIYDYYAGYVPESDRAAMRALLEV